MNRIYLNHVWRTGILLILFTLRIPNALFAASFTAKRSVTNLSEVLTAYRQILNMKVPDQFPPNVCWFPGFLTIKMVRFQMLLSHSMFLESFKFKTKYGKSKLFIDWSCKQCNTFFDLTQCLQKSSEEGKRFN